MSYCELCGKQATEKRGVIIDGSVFNVCISCSKHGKPYTSGVSSVKKKSSSPRPKPASARIKMTDETVLSPDFAGLIREGRMKKGITHEQMGMQMNEKANLLRKLESGALKPDEIMAQKLERFLGVKLYVSLDEMDEGERQP